MKRTLLIAIPALVLGLWIAPPAQAGDWHFGAAFRIGDVHFSIGYQDDHRDRYYYRTRVELGRHYYGRTHRHEDCYYHDGHYYHAQHCPLIAAYSRDHGYRTSHLIAKHAPGHHRRGHHYDRRHHRRDHHYDHGRSHGRYRGKGQYRQHGKYRPRGHYRGSHRSHGYCPYHGRRH